MGAIAREKITTGCIEIEWNLSVLDTLGNV